MRIELTTLRVYTWTTCKDIILSCSSRILYMLMTLTLHFLCNQRKSRCLKSNWNFNDFSSVEEWCCTGNRLLINPEKTKFMLFGTRQFIGKLNDITISFLGRDLSSSPFCKNLWVIFWHPILPEGVTRNSTRVITLPPWKYPHYHNLKDGGYGTVAREV